MVSKFIIAIFFVIGLCDLSAQNHPSIYLTTDGVTEIRKGLDNAPMFDSILNKTIDEIEFEVTNGVDVPVPVDLAGDILTNVINQISLYFKKQGFCFR
ncbi:hypothetical protein [Mangrovivirga cuniculi]|uniref:Uncharacterized protein n=1 Tax=Mangrovivirga cuniculi TaxID=2715131 RepID=A0A4D7K0D0_9BACT|nr:hypothetical protein [Mangrovivirga cuniculi]QCK16415.1 hypothetical protein DCC35_17595 [Mangrovivirga cuniculi]